MRDMWSTDTRPKDITPEETPTPPTASSANSERKNGEKSFPGCRALTKLYNKSATSCERPLLSARAVLSCRKGLQRA